MNKKELILDTALRLFVENGFHGTATSKIAQESGVANGTLFNYFSTKDILITSIYSGIIKKKDSFIMESIGTNSLSKESFSSLFFASLQWNLNNTLEYQYLQQFNYSPYSKVATNSSFNHKEHPLYILIQNGIDLVLLKHLPAALIFSLFNAQIKGLYDYIILMDIGKDKQPDLIEETFDLLWKMIED
jgi:AcrR family transcriptional regulator